jgi:triphosphoribosyl-dephospho-CoA synthase
MPTASLESIESIERLAPQANWECRDSRANAVGALVCQALLKEVELTPKPGLVDRLNNGSHRDMDRMTFHASIATIAPWFPIFYSMGASTRSLPPEALLALLRPEGLACEDAMLRATSNVNTHKGGIFSMGLLCAAAGRIDYGEDLPDRERLCGEVALICSHLVETELRRSHIPRTTGEKLFQAYGLTGIRGEAASGFKTVCRHSLPAFERISAFGGSEDDALHDALLHLLAVNHDTNLVHRGGLAGLAYVQAQARNLIEAGGVLSPRFEASMFAFDSDLIKQNLSPGGSADLLAVTWFLSRFPAPVRARRIDAWFFEEGCHAIGSVALPSWIQSFR